MKINKTQRKSLMQNVNYQNYDKKKQELKKKYPEKVFEIEPTGRPRLDCIRYEEKERELHKDYLRNIATLLMEPNGDYQKYSWDTISEFDKVVMERKTRGRKNYKYD